MWEREGKRREGTYDTGSPRRRATLTNNVDIPPHHPSCNQKVAASFPQLNTLINSKSPQLVKIFLDTDHLPKYLRKL